MKHIISYSGGLASFFEAKLSIDKYGENNVELVFCDTKTEDEDLYRFLDDTEKYLGKKIIKLVEGRDIWQVAFDRNYMFNSMLAECSLKLKIEMFKSYISKYDMKDIIVHIGYDYTEAHRFERTKPHYECEIKSLIMETNLTKGTMKDELCKMGIILPKLYQEGFAHNNCGGFCFRAGIGHFKQLYLKRPKTYDYHMNKESELREQIGKDVSILKRFGGSYTLYKLKQDFIRNGTQLSFDEELDIGGCSCFLQEDE